MNKRIVKKKLKKFLNDMKSARKNGVSISVKTQMYVDEHGKECDALQFGTRFVQLKRPMGTYL